MPSKKVRAKRSRSKRNKIEADTRSCKTIYDGLPKLKYDPLKSGYIGHQARQEALNKN